MTAQVMFNPEPTSTCLTRLPSKVVYDSEHISFGEKLKHGKMEEVFPDNIALSKYARRLFLNNNLSKLVKIKFG